MYEGKLAEIEKCLADFPQKMTQEQHLIFNLVTQKSFQHSSFVYAIECLTDVIKIPCLPISDVPRQILTV